MTARKTHYTAAMKTRPEGTTMTRPPAGLVYGYGIGTDPAAHREALTAAARAEGCTCPAPHVELPNRAARRKANRTGRPQRTTIGHGTACPLHPDHPANPGQPGPLAVHRRKVDDQ